MRDDVGKAGVVSMEMKKKGWLSEPFKMDSSIVW